jgi:hypothetical protein
LSDEHTSQAEQLKHSAKLLEEAGFDTAAAASSATAYLSRCSASWPDEAATCDGEAPPQSGLRAFF